MLPQARHQDKVKAFGWKSVERNAWLLTSTTLVYNTYDNDKYNNRQVS
jgi:hypothetical protein